MTTLTKERIAAIKKEGSLFVANGEREDGFALDDLCRLALLGLRVKEAPVYVADRREAMWPAEFGVKDGERVRVVEDQE